MAKHGKKFTAARQAVPERPHTIEEAVPLMQKVKFAKFDETVELALRLGVDPKQDRKSTRLNSSHQIISYAVFCLKKKKKKIKRNSTLNSTGSWQMSLQS